MPETCSKASPATPSRVRAGAARGGEGRERVKVRRQVGSLESYGQSPTYNDHEPKSNSD